MKRWVLAVVLVAMSGSAFAEWTSAGGGENSTTYVDMATLRRNGQLAKIWVLFDLKKPSNFQDGAKYMSVKFQEEINCKEEVSRMTSRIAHSGNMGEGTVMYTSSSLGDWEPIPPGSLIATVARIACQR